jgi:hypothetical protein
MKGLPLPKQRTCVLSYKQARRPHSLRDALPAPTTQWMLAAPGHLALLVTGRVPLEQALAWLGQGTGRLRRPWGRARLPDL